MYDYHLATVGHAILFSERCTGTLWATFLMQGTQSHYIHFACKFGDMNTNKPDSCLSAVIHNSLFHVRFTPLFGKSTCRLYVITCFLYGKVTGIEIYDIVMTAASFLEWCAS